MDRRTFLKTVAVGALAGAVHGVSGPFSTLAGADPGFETNIRYPVADSHFHYVDFLQQTDGVKALLLSMKKVGVEHVMFSGMPLIKKWDAAEPEAPRYYLAAQKNLPVNLHNNATSRNRHERPCWLTLVSDFSDCFMIGSDNIGHVATYNRNITKYYQLLDALSPDKAGKVAMTNFLSLLPG